MRLSWRDLGTPRADKAAGKPVELTGFPLTPLPAGSADYFLMMAEPGCCQGCVPNNPLAVVEVLADRPIKLGNGALRMSGTWHVSSDPAGWRYQLHGAEAKPGITRRSMMAASSLFCLPATAMAQAVDGTAVDVHSHAGNLIRASYASYGASGQGASGQAATGQGSSGQGASGQVQGQVQGSGGGGQARDAFVAVTDPMRKGGLSVICLAIVADSPIVVVSNGRFRPGRDPRPGELYNWSKTTFTKLHELVRRQALSIVKTAADLRAARAAQPSVIVTSEGADWLEGKIERLDEAYQRWQLRQLQLTHYRPNELGDIQTEPAVHGGLTDFGAEVIRRCNQLGIVVDVAHGTLDLVKRAVATTTKPLVLSHTALSDRQNPWTRMITSDHARVIASVRGVIGVWPVADVAGISSYVGNIARMVDAVGVDHVGIGTDQLGLLGPSCMPSYAELPQLAAQLRGKFTAEETTKILGGNYRRVFEASLA